ncbi:MAG: thioredoxin family protein [Clostridiales bacterium]|nr:thioredoxin family protein [Clostridiales bacterium]
MKYRPLIIVICICFVGMLSSAVFYLIGQNRADMVYTADLDVDGLQRLLAREDTFVVYFYGRSCEDCAASEPFLLEAVQQMRAEGLWPSGLRIYKCERDANATVRSLYGIERTPTLLFFLTGEENARQEGSLANLAEYSTFFSQLI